MEEEEPEKKRKKKGSPAKNKIKTSQEAQRARDQNLDALLSDWKEKFEFAEQKCAAEKVQACFSFPNLPTEGLFELPLERKHQKHSRNRNLRLEAMQGSRKSCRNREDPRYQNPDLLELARDSDAAWYFLENTGRKILCRPGCSGNQDISHSWRS